MADKAKKSAKVVTPIQRPAPAAPANVTAPAGQLRVKAIAPGFHIGRRRVDDVFYIPEDPKKPGVAPSWCVLVDDDNNPIGEAGETVEVEKPKTPAAEEKVVSDPSATVI